MRLVASLVVIALCSATRVLAGSDPPPAVDPNADPPHGDATHDHAHGAGDAHAHHGGERPAEPQGVWFEGERHLADVKQLTFGGQNAEAYWSPDGDRLIFQWTTPDGKCDQIYTMRVDGSEKSLVSTGKGRTTCSYFVPGTDRVLFSSTHLGGEACPPEPDFSQGYVWPLYETYDIFTAKRDGSDLKRLTETPGYDAEATVSVDGKWIVFTSTRDGDIEIYKMKVDGSEVTRLTHEPGYDGGPFFSADGTKICYRYGQPKDDAELQDFRAMLAKNQVRPRNLEIWWMNADGSGKTRVTDNGAANFAPYFTPEGKRLIFASNMANPRGRDFDLYLVGLDGTGLERVTYCPSFDSFPMFNADGTLLAFASNRNGAVPGETNIFVAKWVE
jgi:Tol biopolymer transport system component